MSSISSNIYTKRNLKLDIFDNFKKDFINELIDTITKEIEQSGTSKYICNDGTVISTDVGYVYDWFKEYADVLRKKYNT